MRFLIREVWKSYFFRIFVYHCEMFNFGTPWKIGVLNISRWQTSFLLKDDFHTSRIKWLDMRPLIREVWKSYFIKKNAYHCEIFNFVKPLKICVLNISRWETSFLLKDDFHTWRLKGRMSDPLIREVWKSSFNRKDVSHCEIFNFDTSWKIDVLNISRWWTSFLVKDDVHTSRIKGSDMRPLIREV